MMIDPNHPALVLAPMEGVTDAPMRDVQGEIGAFSFAVTEFLRVAQTVIPPSVFHRHVPELRSGSRTPSGLPVQVQLLGGDPGRMAASAVVAVNAGATAIDLNFGCPAPSVNNHDGGACLLQYPHRIRAIVAAVRSALPQSIPVSAKMRLGWNDTHAITENATMAVEGGANWLTIHARTRSQGYAPPVYWPIIGKVRETLPIPVIANGDIRTLSDFRRCREETGCCHYMLGRGALADTQLAVAIARDLGLPITGPEPSLTWATHLRRFVDRTNSHPDYRPDKTVRRLKQWLKMAAEFGRFNQFADVKRTLTVDDLFAALGTAQRTEFESERATIVRANEAWHPLRHAPEESRATSFHGMLCHGVNETLDIASSGPNKQQFPRSEA